MGTIHKFPPPPKNENQFKGYRPLDGGLGPRKAKRRGNLRQRMRPWQRTLLVWTLLIAVAAAIVGVQALLAG